MRSREYDRLIEDFLDGLGDWAGKYEYPNPYQMVAIERDNKDGDSVYVFGSAERLDELTLDNLIGVTGGDRMGRFIQFDFVVLENIDFGGGRFWVLVALDPENPFSKGVAGNDWTYDVFLETFMHWAGGYSTVFVVPDVAGVWYGIPYHRKYRPYASGGDTYVSNRRWLDYLGALERWAEYPISVPALEARSAGASSEGGLK